MSKRPSPALKHRLAAFFVCPTVVLLLLMLILPVHATAEETGPEQTHWAFSSFLGTGWYKLDDNREVYVLRVPPRWDFREASIDASGERQLGIEFHFPLTFGLHKIEELEDFVDIDNIGTISFNPGVEIEYPLSDRWRLRAYSHLGWGTEIESSDTAWIFDAGIKSRFAFQNDKLEWAIVNELSYATYDEKQGTQKPDSSGGVDSDGMAGLMTGLDFSYPIDWTPIKGHPLNLNWDVSYRWFQNSPEFSKFDSAPDEINDEWRISLALARRDGPIKIWFLDFEQLGLSYRFDSSGNFQAISMNLRAPFTR